MAADDCTVALCVPVSVAKQRRLDLTDELQLRGSQFFCTSIPGICRAQQRACQHPFPSKNTDAVPLPTKSLHADVMCIVTSKTSRERTHRVVQRNQQTKLVHAMPESTMGAASSQHNCPSGSYRP